MMMMMGVMISPSPLSIPTRKKWMRLQFKTNINNNNNNNDKVDLIAKFFPFHFFSFYSNNFSRIHFRFIHVFCGYFDYYYITFIIIIIIIIMMISYINLETFAYYYYYQKVMIHRKWMNEWMKNSVWILENCYILCQENRNETKDKHWKVKKNEFI